MWCDVYRFLWRSRSEHFLRVVSLTTRRMNGQAPSAVSGLFFPTWNIYSLDCYWFLKCPSFFDFLCFLTFCAWKMLCFTFDHLMLRRRWVTQRVWSMQRSLFKLSMCALWENHSQLGVSTTDSRSIDSDSSRWRSGTMGRELDLWSTGLGFKSYSGQSCVTALGKLFTFMCLCHQAV